MGALGTNGLIGRKNPFFLVGLHSIGDFVATLLLTFIA